MRNFVLFGALVAAFAAGTLLRDQAYRGLRRAESYLPVRLAAITPPAQPVLVRQTRRAPTSRPVESQVRLAAPSTTAGVQDDYGY